MIWSDFKDEVRTLLTVDAKRKGAGIQGYVDSIILSGCIELQQYIPSLRSLNRNTYGPGDLARVAYGTNEIQRGQLDAKGKVTTATVLIPQTDRVVAIELNRWPWEKRNSMGMGCLSDCRSPRYPGKIMMQPGTRSFHIYPELGPDDLLLLDWEGVKTTYYDTDDTVYDHRVVKTVSNYAKAHIVREVDKDLKLYQEYYTSYIKERAVLFLDEKDTTLFDMPSITKDHYSRCCIKSTPPPAAPPLPVFGLNIDSISPYPFYGLDAFFVPSAPEELDIANGYLNIYGNLIVDASTSVPAPPDGLETSPSAAPTGLDTTVDVAAPPSGLDALASTLAPTGLAFFLDTEPLAPWGLVYAGDVPTAPSDLGSPPYAAPSNLYAVDASLIPDAPDGLDTLVGPTDLDARRSNSTGTIIDPASPTALSGKHDGAGGTWVPNAPTILHAQEQTAVPHAPSGLGVIVAQYTILHYVYDPVLHEFTLQSVDQFTIGEGDTEFDVFVDYE